MHFLAFLACVLILCWKLETTDQVIGTEVNRPVRVSFYDDLARNSVVLSICCICSWSGAQNPSALLVFFSSANFGFPTHFP